MRVGGMSMCVMTVCSMRSMSRMSMPSVTMSRVSVCGMSMAGMPMAVGNRVRAAMRVIAMLSKTAQHHAEQTNRAEREECEIDIHHFSRASVLERILDRRYNTNGLHDLALFGNALGLVSRKYLEDSLARCSDSANVAV